MPTQSSASMTVTQQLVASIEAKDTEGNPTDPNTIVWTSSDESIAVVVPQPGGLKANIIAGAPGECKVVVNANAVKGGKGAKPVLGILNLTVTSGDVAEVKIVTEKPVEQGTAPDAGLPSRPPRPGNALPTPPGSQPGIDNTLPGQPNYPSTGVPPARPDAGLPNAPARPDAGLPPTPGTKPVDEEEGEHIPGAQPKKRY
jgi:hypothetical protein